MLHSRGAFLLSPSPQSYCLAKRVILNSVWSRKLISYFNSLCFLNVILVNQNIMVPSNFRYKSFWGNFSICTVWWFLKRWILTFILRLSLILREENLWENLNLPLLLYTDVCHTILLLIYSPSSTLNYLSLSLWKVYSLFIASKLCVSELVLKHVLE